MSNGSKQQYKQFTISSIEDGCAVLSMLIAGVSKNLEKYKKYASEAYHLFSNTETEVISADEYDNVNDKLLYRQREILKYTADHQTTSFSYIGLRKLLENKSYLKTTLSDEISTLLNELLQVRNWTFHNPQSLLVAAKEVAKNNIPAELKSYAKIVPQLNPVYIQEVEKYDIMVLFSLILHTQKRVEQFESILNQMKRDYQELFDSLKEKPLLLSDNGLTFDVQYITIPITARLDDYGSDVSQISMAIQKSKYDGSSDKFNDWVIRFGKSPPVK